MVILDDSASSFVNLWGISQNVMPSSTWLAVYGVLARHGVNTITTKDIAKNDLRNWELGEIEQVFSKVHRPFPGYCYFRTPFYKPPGENFTTWWPSIWASSKDSKWVSPSRHLMYQSVREQAALCVNARGEWSLRRGGYVALSHVWVEGLQRDKEHDGLLGEKFGAIFTLLSKRGVEAEWVWADVLAIPGGDPAKASSEDEKLTIDIINTLPLIYARADTVIILDALVLQLMSESLIDVAVALVCGQWITRVWTFQEIKLSSHALVITATGYQIYSDIVRHLETLADAKPTLFRNMYLRLATLEKNDERGLSIPDITMACRSRRSGVDIDYARAFFPVLGLEWKHGMTREEGMQTIFRSQKRHAPRIACFFGAPRMKVNLAWAPSYLYNLEGMITDSLQWDDRGIRGQWYVLRIARIIKKFPHSRMTVLNLELDCSGHQEMQCALAANEDPDVIQELEEAIGRGQVYIISLVPSKDALKGEWARQALLVEEDENSDATGELEVLVYCATIIKSQNLHHEESKSVLLLHGGPTHIQGRMRNGFARLEQKRKQAGSQNT